MKLVITDKSKRIFMEWWNDKCQKDRSALPLDDKLQNKSADEL